MAEKHAFLVVFETVPRHLWASQHDRMLGFFQSYGTWWHYTSSTWIIITDRHQRAEQLSKAIKNATGETQAFMIMRVPRDIDWSGRLNKAAWSWLRETLPIPKEPT